jgi:hypothetical protein
MILLGFLGVNIICLGDLQISYGTRRYKNGSSFENLGWLKFCKCDMLVADFFGYFCSCEGR